MTARSIRRAAERQAAKLARRDVNRQNAQLSTGPRTEEGKAAASLNAVKTGLTGRTVLLPSDDAKAYQQHIGAYERELQPNGLRERELVQQIADTQWRLARIPALERAIYAKGRTELAMEPCDENNGPVPAALIDAEVYLRYEKSLRNLSLQESRLRRQSEKDRAELKALQAERKSPESEHVAPVKALSTSQLASFFQPSYFSENNHNAARTTSTPYLPQGASKNTHVVE